MNFKKKWQRFWTLNRHHDGGFTLVELIVVIAIMAILAGVAVPAYTGYIKRAHEAQDQLLIAAVNEAFAGGCLEAGVEVSTVTDAKISVVSQCVFGVSSVEGATDEQLIVIYNTFNQLFKGNFNTPFVTENVLSLDWVPEEHSFVMDHVNGADVLVMLSNGPTIIPAEAMSAIADSFLGDLNAETLSTMMEDIQNGAVDTLLGVVDDTVESIAKAANKAAGGGLRGAAAETAIRLAFAGVKAITDEEQFGAYIALQSTGLKNNTEIFGNRYDAINNGLQSLDPSVREAAMEEYTNAMLLYTANALYDQDAQAIQNNVITDYHNTTKDLVSTGGNGAKVVSAALRETLYQGYLNTEAGQNAYANATGDEADKKAALTSSADFTTYLNSPQCGNDIAGMIATMGVIQQNKNNIGIESLLQEGMSNEDAQNLFGAITGS